MADAHAFWLALEAAFLQAAEQRSECRALVARWHYQCGWTFHSKLPGCADRVAVDRFKALARMAAGGPPGNITTDGWRDWLDLLREALGNADCEDGGRRWTIIGVDGSLPASEEIIELTRTWDKDCDDWWSQHNPGLHPPFKLGQELPSEFSAHRTVMKPFETAGEIENVFEASANHCNELACLVNPSREVTADLGQPSALSILAIQPDSEPVAQEPTVDKPSAPQRRGGRPRGAPVNALKLRELRGRMKLSQFELADKCGISDDVIQRGEAGGRWADKTFGEVTKTISMLLNETIGKSDLVDLKNPKN